MFFICYPHPILIRFHVICRAEKLIDETVKKAPKRKQHDSFIVHLVGIMSAFTKCVVS